MLALRLIERKRNGGKSSRGSGAPSRLAYAAGHIPDYQMAALLMAAFSAGSITAETVALTEAMLDSGARFDLGFWIGPPSTNIRLAASGDKVSIVLAPLIASAGLAVPMMSGRGLGHTGGTLDKLESIPGFRTDLSLADARAQLEPIHCAMIGQTSGNRAGRSKDVCAAQRDGHGRFNSADRGEHHEQETRGRPRRTGARHQARQRRVSSRPSTRS